jgi:hypothetical protein
VLQWKERPMAMERASTPKAPTDTKRDLPRSGNAAPPPRARPSVGGKPSDPERGATASCLVCGQPLQRKQTGRAPKYCCARCRDKAREARTFAVSGVARLRGGTLDASLEVLGIPDSAIPRNAPIGGTAPLDVIGHASHRFDSALRLDPVDIRAILDEELPATNWAVSS